MTPAEDRRLHPPYKFLDSYGPDDRDIFVARDREAETLVGDIISSRLVVLFAKTGTGKTSLINAGVRPRLEDRGYATFFIRAREDPLQSARATLRADAPGRFPRKGTFSEQLRGLVRRLKQ